MRNKEEKKFYSEIDEKELKRAKELEKTKKVHHAIAIYSEKLPDDDKRHVIALDLYLNTDLVCLDVFKYIEALMIRGITSKG